MTQLLLNIDAGEQVGEPEELFALAHVVSIACGGHAGDATSIDRALVAASKGGSAVGAHPSFVDREGFGRRTLTVTPADLRHDVREQVALLVACATRAGLGVLYVKPHGALYHAADRISSLAVALLEGCLDALPRFTLVGPPGGELSRAARERGLPFAREGFADRSVRPDGTLVPRGEPGALILDPNAAAERAREIARSHGYDTVCVHSDTDGAVAIARAVRAAVG